MKAFRFVKGIATNVSRKVGNGMLRQMKKLLANSEELYEIGKIAESLIRQKSGELFDNDFSCW